MKPELRKWYYKRALTHGTFYWYLFGKRITTTTGFGYYVGLIFHVVREYGELEWSRSISSDPKDWGTTLEINKPPHFVKIGDKINIIEKIFRTGIFQ